MRREVCAHPGLDGAVVPQDKDSTVKVVLLGGEGWCVDGDVWVSVSRGKSWWVCAVRAARVQKCLRSCFRSGYLLLSESR